MQYLKIIVGQLGSLLLEMKTILKPNVMLWTSWYYKAGFDVSEVTSGLSPGFQSYDVGSLLTGVHRHSNKKWFHFYVRHHVHTVF